MLESVNGENPRRSDQNPMPTEGPPYSVRVAHPEKIIFPEVRLRRIDLMVYYEQIASRMLPYLKGRALTIIRWPDGIDGPRFYQRHPAPHTPLLISDADALIQWVARGAVEFHAPLGLVANPLVHDWAVLDLDPDQTTSWIRVREGAGIVAEFFRLCAIPFGLKTSGKRGVHFFIPIVPTLQATIVYWMRTLATLLCDAFPESFTVERLKSRRGHRIYLDYLQNGQTRTMAAIYSVRATRVASASTPVRLEELMHPPAYWTPKRVLAERAHQDDLWSALATPIDLGQILRERHLLGDT